MDIVIFVPFPQIVIVFQTIGIQDWDLLGEFMSKSFERSQSSGLLFSCKCVRFFRFTISGGIEVSELFSRYNIGNCVKVKISPGIVAPPCQSSLEILYHCCFVKG